MALYSGTSTSNTAIISPGTEQTKPTPSAGSLRFNTTDNTIDGYSTSWTKITVTSIPAPTTINTGNITFMQCMDHYSTFYYDGNGNFYVESREPGGNIHTGRGDCSDAQGQILRYTFNKTGYTSITGSISMSGRDGSATLNFSSINPSSTYGPTNIGVTDGSSGASGYSYTLNMTIT